jgi:hypothetical protein
MNTVSAQEKVTLILAVGDLKSGINPSRFPVKIKNPSVPRIGTYCFPSGPMMSLAKPSINEWKASRTC